MNFSGFDEGSSAKNVVKKDPHTSCQNHFWFTAFPEQRSADVMAEPASIFTSETLYLSSPALQACIPSVLRLVNLVMFIPDVHLHSITELVLLNFFDILPCNPPPGFPFATSTLHTFTIFFFFLFYDIAVFHSLCGSSVIKIFLRWRISFHRGTGGGLGGASSGHSRILVNRTMWLHSKERPYRRRDSEESACDVKHKGRWYVA